ncbi:MAG: serine/threonine protein kinase [Oleiphilaceae bacterium]|jgi:serine/threonine protein kinase
MNLNSLLKEQTLINTDLGEFTYISSLGEGGNSFVFKFHKKGNDYAIKFLKVADTDKINRFKDEFFCAMQISTNKNVVQAYHFDYVTIGTLSYYIIIMKYYQGTLNSEGNISLEDEESKSEKGWELFKSIANGLSHLHNNKIIHRDIKPQNIFYDDSTKSYVIGDLGIAHFCDENFPKDSKTKRSDRMANFTYSAPEQLNSKLKITESSDIYSLGQVLHWYLTGNTIRGLGKTAISNNNSPSKLRWLDSIIDICLMNQAEQRFQSIKEIKQHVDKLKEPSSVVDYWGPIDNFDEVIRMSFPNIKNIKSTSDKSLINRFFTNFHKQCNDNDFWFMDVEGGDNKYQEIINTPDEKLLFQGYVELNIEHLIVYKDDHHPYKSFFIILTSESTPFDIVDSNGEPLVRNIPSSWKTDLAVYFEGKYIEYNETKNGYYDFNGEVIPVTSDKFEERMRHLRDYAYIIVPKGTASAQMMDRNPTKEFISDVLSNKHVKSSALNIYMEKTRYHHSDEITKWN